MTASPLRAVAGAGADVVASQDETERPVVVLGGLLLGQQSSHQRAAELTSDIGVEQSRNR
jgi:hypothetical protein